MPNETSIPGVGKDGPKNLKELRLSLGFENPDLANIDVSAEERKYRIE